MAIRYIDGLRPDTYLSSIVMAGSHDAGIFKGAGNVKTQTYNIGRQAEYGVRLFDVRVGKFGILGFRKLKTYHGSTLFGTGVGTPLGSAGQDLKSIFLQSKNFVKDSGEFVFLKFDHSSGFSDIAKMARDLIGDEHLYTGNGCLNEMKLGDLRGKVFVLIMSSDWNKMKQDDRVGTLPIYKYDKTGSYQAHAPGMQYVGKGGTDPVKNVQLNPTKKGRLKSFEKKLQENVKTQKKYLAKLQQLGGKNGNPLLMGMMYWTTTGALQNIKKRNTYLWNRSDGIEDLWQAGVGEFVEASLPDELSERDDYSTGSVIKKKCLPNFVLIDFADEGKCETIYALNELAATKMVEYRKKQKKWQLETIETEI